MLGPSVMISQIKRLLLASSVFFFPGYTTFMVAAVVDVTLHGYISCTIATSQSENLRLAVFQKAISKLLIIEATDGQKLPILLSCLLRDGSDILDGLPEPKTTVVELTERFDCYFNCLASLLLRRKAFYTVVQGQNERATDYTFRLRRLAKYCEFGSSQETVLRVIFVIVIRHDATAERLISEDASLVTFEGAVDRRLGRCKWSGSQESDSVRGEAFSFRFT